MEEPKQIRKTIIFTPRMYEMVESVMEERGYPSFSAAIHQAVVGLHQSVFPAYIRKEKAPTGEERVKFKDDEKKAKEELFIKEQKKIADKLNGEVYEKGGILYCKYYTYTGKKRFEQNIPLRLLSSDIVITQYQPSREKVEALQKLGKTEY